MLNQVPVDLGVPFISDPQNLPNWANYLTVFLEREWANMSGRINSLLPNDGSEGKAWTAYTPSVSPCSGAFTSVSADGRYYKIGRVVHFQAHVHITTNGTAASCVIIGLPPFTAAPTTNIVLSGRADSVSGKMLQAIVHNNATTVSIFNYDNTYPGATGEDLYIGGMYESTT